MYDYRERVQGTAMQIVMGGVYLKPVPLSPNAQVGLSDVVVTRDSTTLSCSFTRHNMHDYLNYKSLVGDLYILGAYGAGKMNILVSFDNYLNCLQT